MEKNESLNMLPYFPLVGYNEKYTYIQLTYRLQRVNLLKYQNSDLQQLLSMPEQEFLNHILSDKSVISFIGSYLRLQEFYKNLTFLDSDHVLMI